MSHLRPSPDRLDAQIRSITYCQDSMVKLLMDEMRENRSAFADEMKQTRAELLDASKQNRAALLDEMKQNRNEVMEEIREIATPTRNYRWNIIL